MITAGSYFLATCFVWMMTSSGLMTYYMLRHLSKLEKILSGVQAINDNKKYYANAGFVGIMIRFQFISTLITLPNLSTRKGLISAAELNSIPKKIKIEMNILWGSLSLSMAVSCIAIWIIKGNFLF